MNKSAIPHAIAQEVFASASNAADKGLSQFFTPPAFGRQLATALPAHRQVLVDLNCGNGALLQASANPTTRHLLGADIDPGHFGKDASPQPSRAAPSKIAYDLTLTYPLLVEVDWSADCFVLNPPWRLFWHRARLAALADSSCRAVRAAFAGIEALAPKGTIDSTIATLLIALDRCTRFGEGLLIANNATLERLIFTPGAPHADLADHIWARLIIPGNPMTGLTDCKWVKETDAAENTFHTGVIYFAREHRGGGRSFLWHEPDAENPTPLPDRCYRLGGEVRNEYGGDDETQPRWQIVKERVAEIKGSAPKTPWNLWRDPTGTIRTALSSFEHHSKKLDKREADRLFKLNGKAPMQLVLQRADRDELLAIAERGGWRVQPELLTAVHTAIRDYHAARAPLYPLTGIQRLGYCDEQDWLACQKDLMLDDDLVFRAGRKYPLRTQTVEVERRVNRPNATTGQDEECLYSGHELAIFLCSAEFQTDEAAPEVNGTREYSFMDAKLKLDKKTKVPEARGKAKGCELPTQRIDFTLQQLTEHFVIPEVPDVASVNPQGYQANLAKLAELESTLASLAA